MRDVVNAYDESGLAVIADGPGHYTTLGFRGPATEIAEAEAQIERGRTLAAPQPRPGMTVEEYRATLDAIQLARALGGEAP